MKGRTIQKQLEEDYLDAPGAAEALGLDKSHLCVQLRAGKLPGAFQWGSTRLWFIPRVAVESYRETHANPDRHRRK
jgi:hypothetical protein